MPDKHLIDQIMQTLDGLHANVLLLDKDGKSMPAGEETRLPPFEDGYETVIHEGATFAKVASQTVLYICVKGMDDAARDLALLAAALVSSLAKEPVASGLDDVIRAALREELSGPELDALSAEYGIQMVMDRCVMLFHGTSSTMKDLIVVGEDDMLIEMDRHALVLIKSMNNIDGYDELSQLAEAMEQTIMSETGEQPLISIGEVKPSMLEIGASYRAAWRALEIGRMFHPEKNIYAFGRLILERFLSEISRELGTRYHHMLFNRKTQRLFNEEMLHTIEMFFEKDLNLSDTARQLYIHRNTLVYRLDKIQRQTGLDLRNFEDAITFRMLLLLGKSGGDKPISVR